MTLGFLSGSRNFCKLQASCSAPRTFASSFRFPEKFLFCTDTTGSIVWPSLAPRLHIDACFRDSQPSLRTLWSAVIKSPKFSARSTTLPIRLLHGALVILVLWQISQFRSFGNWVSTLCSPKSTPLIGSEDGSWEELACESVFRNSFIHKILSDFLQPLWYVGIIRVSPYLSIHTYTWHCCWRVIWMMNFLWRCRECWSRRAWGRTSW